MSSSLAQSVLMALTVTVNRFASSKVQAVQKREGRRSATEGRTTKGTSTHHHLGLGRRVLLLSAASSAAAASQLEDSRTLLLKKYLKKSKENKTKNDKERLESYYKRNYKDYFEFVEGSLRGRREEELTESEKRIREWLQNNK